MISERKIKIIYVIGLLLCCEFFIATVIHIFYSTPEIHRNSISVTIFSFSLDGHEMYAYISISSTPNMKNPSVVVMKHSNNLILHQKFIDQQKTQLAHYFVFSDNSEQVIEENMFYLDFCKVVFHTVNQRV
jgi:hypothetical protein